MNPFTRFGSWFSTRFLRRYADGFLPLHLWSGSPEFNEYHKESQKLSVIFANPALLKVFCLQCDLFSLAKVYVYNKKGIEQPDDPALDRIANPNPMQSQSQWLWDYMFWKMLGNAYLYMDSDLIERMNAPMYWLENQKLEFPSSLDTEKDKLVFSEAKRNRLLETEIIYRYQDGSVFRFPLKKLCHISDLTNGVGNWFKGHSRIDALYKVISNSEASLDSKNINVRFTSKFIVSGQTDPKDVTKVPMGKAEKESIEKRINGTTFEEDIHGEKQVHAMRTAVDIKRFVDDLRVLELDKSYLADYYLIGSMYNIPRDVLEAYNSSTFENQEKARAGHVSYTLEPAGEALGTMLAKRWGYDARGRKIILSWDHLPFTQVFEKDRANIQQTKANTLAALLRMGLKLEEINIFLDTNFSEVEVNETEETNT